jgi:hypothetical protein
MNRRAAIATLLYASLCRVASAVEFGPKQVALLMLRILAYDRSFKARADGKTAPILLVYQEGNEHSETMQVDLNNVFEELSGSVTVGGLPLRISALAYTKPLALEARVLSLHPVALFVCPGLADSIPQISAVCRKRAVLSMTTTNAYLRSGLSVGLSAGEDRIHMAINLPASKAEGADLDAALLRIAEVYR